MQETRGYAAFTISFTFDPGSCEIDLNGCLYRKLKPARRMVKSAKDRL